MMRNEERQNFTLYRWNNPETSSDYPFLAVSAERVLLALGNHAMAFDWSIPDDVAELLTADFVPTGTSLQVNLTDVRAALDTTFVHGTESGSLAFDARLSPCRLQLVLGKAAQAVPDHLIEDSRGAEYVIEGFGSYLRCAHPGEDCVPVTFVERSMLDTCISTFAELAARCAALITEPPPPRYRTGAVGAPPTATCG